MKRIVCALVIILTLCGCSGKLSSFKINPESLNTAFHAKIDGSEYEGYLSFDSGTNMTVMVNYPDIISGVSMTFCADTVLTAVDNVEETHSAKDFPNDFSFLCIYNALKTAVSGGEFKRNADSAYEMTCEGVTLVADKNGNLTSASLENGFFIFGL